MIVIGEFEKIKVFFDTLGYAETRSKPMIVENGHYPFVTISRQAGAGGRTLAAAILKEMKEKGGPLFQGWKMFDQELCTLVAEDPRLKVSLHSLLTEEHHSQIEDILDELVVGYTSQEVVIRKIFQIMRTLATLGKVILVGRGGACFTRNFPLGIHLRLVAPLPTRIKRMQGLLDLNEKKARELVLEQDAARKKLVRDYFDKEIDNPLLYDVVWNTDSVSIDEIAELTVKMVKEKGAGLVSKR